MCKVATSSSSSTSRRPSGSQALRAFKNHHLSSVPRSYVQSKGRARAKPSNYILMVGDGELEKEKRIKQYEQFKRVEEIALQECHNRPEDEEVGATLL